MLFSIKIYKNRSIAQKARTRKIRRFLKIIRSIKWEDSTIRAYIKVNYGKLPDCYGKKVNFYNDGDYDNKQDFCLAADAFLED